MSWAYSSVTSRLTGEAAEAFRGLLPEKQQALAEICDVESYVTDTGLFNTTIRFWGRRLRDGGRYASPVGHHVQLDRDWLIRCFPDARIRATADLLLREAT